MCGILGSLSFKTPLKITSEDLLRIKHRGPNGQGIHSDENVSLGHVRLSIIDLSENATQPMHSHDGRFTIIFNGEIYNYLELKEDLKGMGFSLKTSSDTEVLLYAYIAWKEKCLDKLRGMYAFAIWDKVDKKLFMARDAFGEKPLLYWQDKDLFIFSSEYKGLLPLIPEQLEIDTDAANIYLHYQFLVEPNCFFKNVKKLPPGHYLELSEQGFEAKPVQFWSTNKIRSSNTSVLSYRDILKQIEAKLEDSVRLCLRSDVPVGIALSGGIDSGAIAALTKKISNQPLHVFSVGYPGKPAYDERDSAKRLSDQLGFIFNEVEIPIHQFVDHFPKLVQILDEPIADIAAFAHYSVPKSAADKGVKVLLSGIGGDELFWGYAWVSVCVEMNRMRRKKLIKFLAGLFSNNRITRKISRILERRVKNPNKLKSFLTYVLNFDKINKSPSNQMVWYELHPDFQYAQKISDLQKNQGLTIVNDVKLFSEMKNDNSKSLPLDMLESLNKTWLVSNCLNLGDRVSMAVGVETRLPLLDRQLAELLIDVRRYNEDHHLEQKKWLKDTLVDLLPKEVLSRPKSGFRPPVEDWALGVVKKYGSIVKEGYLIKYKVISSDVLKTLWSDIDAGNHTARMYMYKVTLLELWFQSMNDLIMSCSKGSILKSK